MSGDPELEAGKAAQRTHLRATIPNLDEASPDLYIALLAIEEYILQAGEYAPNTFNRVLQDVALEALSLSRGDAKNG